MVDQLINTDVHNSLCETVCQLFVSASIWYLMVPWLVALQIA